MKKIIGLIGGMGPYASAYLYNLMIKIGSENYGAKNNDDYPEIIIDSVPVPDFISDVKRLDEARDILISRVKSLSNFGCTTIAMACNTGHILYPDLVKVTKANFPSLIDLVSISANRKGLKRVGLLATKTTIESRIYDSALMKLGIQICLPDNKFLQKQEEIIRYVIANGETRTFENVLIEMTQKFIDKEHLDGIILGCTELSLAFPKNKFKNTIDSLDTLANYLLREFYLGFKK